MPVDLLQQPALAWLATYLVHSTLLCLAAWAFDAWSRRTNEGTRSLGRTRERLWKLALFLPLLTTLAQRGTALSFWALERPAHELQGTTPDAQLSPLPILLAIPRAALDSARTSAEVRHFSWLELAGLVWVAGIALGAWIWLREWRALGRILRGIAPCTDPELAAEFDALRARDPALASTRLYVGRGVLVPLTLGWLRTRVVVPERALRELDPEERRALLAHELAHASRRDPLWLSAARAVESLCFFQPLNRLARIRLCDEAEFLADRWAVERGVEPLSLASCLTEVAGWIVAGRRALPVPSMASRGRRLTQRVERLLDERRAPLALRRAPWAAGLFALAFASAVAAVPGEARSRNVSANEPASPATPVGFVPMGPERTTTRATATTEPAELDEQFSALRLELAELATRAEERELSPAWHAQLARLQQQASAFESKLARLSELIDAEPDTTDDPTSHP